MTFPAARLLKTGPRRIRAGEIHRTHSSSRSARRQHGWAMDARLQRSCTADRAIANARGLVSWKDPHTTEQRHLSRMRCRTEDGQAHHHQQQQTWDRLLHDHGIVLRGCRMYYFCGNKSDQLSRFCLTETIFETISFSNQGLLHDTHFLKAICGGRTCGPDTRFVNGCSLLSLLRCDRQTGIVRAASSRSRPRNHMSTAAGASSKQPKT